MEIDVNELIHRLDSMGLTAPEIGDVLEIETSVVKTVLSEGKGKVREEEELRERLLRLANDGIDEAFRMLRTGTATQKMQVLRMILGNASKSLGKEDSSEFSEMRLAIERLMAQNKEGVVNPSAISSIANLAVLNDALKLGPAPIRTDDPD